jgi:pimeloyl-ACP methyl ester carboxylesterase
VEQPVSRSHEGLLCLPGGDEVHVRVVHDDGADGVPVLLNDGLGCDGYVWKHLIDWLRRRHPLIHWNYRGHGDSPPPASVTDYTLDALLDDLEAVLASTGYGRAVFAGHSMGVQVALESWKRRPERVLGLMLLFGSYERPIDSWHGAYRRQARPPLPNVLARRYFDRLSRGVIDKGHLLRPVWSRILPRSLAYQVATRFEVDGSRLSWKDFGPYLKGLAHMDPRIFFHLARELAEHSAADYLGDVDVPALVVGGTRDTFTPGWRSEEMARQLPDAELLIIEGASHTGPLEHTTLIGQRASRFLQRITDEVAAAAEAVTADAA